MSSPKPFHYAWVIVLAGALTIFCLLRPGALRFRHAAAGDARRPRLSIDDMGFLSTGNFAGYLVAVGLAPLALRYVSARKLVTGSLLVIGLCLLVISQSSDYRLLGALYTLIGMGGGFANIPIMALVSRWFRRERRGQAAGMMIMGNGTAIILTGFLVPWLNATFGGQGWRIGWMTLGGACLVLGGVVGLLLRNDPAELGLEPLGAPQPVNYVGRGYPRAVPRVRHSPAPGRSLPALRPDLHGLRHLHRRHHGRRVPLCRGRGRHRSGRGPASSASSRGWASVSSPIASGGAAG